MVQTLTRSWVIQRGTEAPMRERFELGQLMFNEANNGILTVMFLALMAEAA